MSTETVENTETTETETTETEQESTVDFYSDPMAKFEFDADEIEKAANDDNGNIVTKVLAERKPIYNELVDLVSTYQAATDIDGSVSEFIASSENEKIVELREKKARAEAAVKKLNEQLSALATEEMQKEIAPDFDAEQAKRDYQDKVVAIKDGADFLRQLFTMTGHLSMEQPEATEKNKRPRAIYTAQTEQGAELLKMLNHRPNLGGSTSKPSGEGKIIRAWAEEKGLIEKGKVGKLPTDVKEQWEKAGKPGI